MRYSFLYSQAENNLQTDFRQFYIYLLLLPQRLLSYFEKKLCKDPLMSHNRDSAMFTNSYKYGTIAQIYSMSTERGERKKTTPTEAGVAPPNAASDQNKFLFELVLLFCKWNIT